MHCRSGRPKSQFHKILVLLTFITKYPKKKRIMEENQHPISHLEMDSLSITEMDISFLNETRKWTMFLSILGFIMSGLIAIVGLFAGSIFSAIPNSAFANMPAGFGFMMGGIYIGMGVLYFFPSWYLYKYSQHLRTALQSSDSGELTAQRLEIDLVARRGRLTVFVEVKQRRTGGR